MKLLKCKICHGEVEILDDGHSVSRKVKCTKCGHSNATETVKEPEVVIIRKRPIIPEEK